MTTTLAIHRVATVACQAQDFDWGATVELEFYSKTRAGKDLGCTQITLFCDDKALAHHIADAIKSAVAAVDGHDAA